MINFDKEKEYMFLNKAKTQYMPIKVLQVSGEYAKISYQNRDGKEMHKIVPADLIRERYREGEKSK